MKRLRIIACLCFLPKLFLSSLEAQPVSFVTVASPTNVAYSSNGLTWNAASIPLSANWQAIAYGNGTWVTVANGSNVVAYSSNGINWAISTIPSTNSWNYLTFGNGVFITVCTTEAAYSTDAVHWAVAPLPYASFPAGGTAYGNGAFVAIPYGSSNATYSTNGGSNWLATSMPVSADWRTIAYGDGVFAAVGGGSSNAAYSTNGINWYSNSLPLTGNWSDMAFGNGTFVLIDWNSATPLYSTNGINWAIGSDVSNPWYAVTYASSLNPPFGEFLTVDLNSTLSAYSTNGITWSNSPGSLPESASWWFVAGNTTPDCTATAVANVNGGLVYSVTVLFEGCGEYTNTPDVILQGGGGSGALASAVVNNGYIVQINISFPGSGYTNSPTVVIGYPPVITNQPQTVVVNKGASATFSVGASNAPLFYQWAFAGTNIAGATSTSLSITNVAQTNLGTYSVLVSNIFGSVRSSNAVLGMYPYISSSPTNMVVLWGQNVTLAVTAGGSTPLAYQWYDNGAALPSATASALNFANIQFTNSGNYNVVVSNAYGAVSNAARQLIVEPAGVSLGFCPEITITGTIGYSYTVKRTANLNNTNSWVTVTNLTLTQTTQVWADTSIDTALPGYPVEYYEVLPNQ